jgi:hypothetical protein
MKNSLNKKIAYFTVITLIFSLGLLKNSSAETGSFGVFNYDLNLNTEFVIAINVSDLNQAGTVEFVLSYDPSYLAFVRAEEGAVMSPVFGLVFATSTEAGRENLSVAIATEAQAVSGSGELAKVVFRTKTTSGATAIRMNSMTVYPANFSKAINAVTAPEVVVNISIPQNTSSVSVIAESWVHGSTNTNSSEYWNLQPVNVRNEFMSGESLCVLSKIADIKNNHRWKTEFFRNGQLIWIDESPWLNVGSGWDYTNAMPVLSNLQTGLGMVRVSIDQGNGYVLKSELYYNVTSSQIENEYLGAKTCNAWEQGLGAIGTVEYWNLRCIDEKNIFNEGERAYILAKVGNISVEHTWLIKVFYNNIYEWEYSSGIQNLNKDHWTYSNFAPYVNNLRPGAYRLELYFKTSGAYNLVDTKNLTVNTLYQNSIPYTANFNVSDYGFIQEDNSSTQDPSMRIYMVDGRASLEMAASGPAGTYWHIQTKKIGLEFANGVSYQGRVWLKAEKPGSITVSVQKDTSPWNNLGLWKELQLTTAWKEYNIDFIFNGAVPPSDIRFTIMHGALDGKVWMDDLSFSKK